MCAQEPEAVLTLVMMLLDRVAQLEARVSTLEAQRGGIVAFEEAREVPDQPPRLGERRTLRADGRDERPLLVRQPGVAPLPGRLLRERLPMGDLAGPAQCRVVSDAGALERVHQQVESDPRPGSPPARPGARPRRRRRPGPGSGSRRRDATRATRRTSPPRDRAARRSLHGARDRGGSSRRTGLVAPPNHRPRARAASAAPPPGLGARGRGSPPLHPRAPAPPRAGPLTRRRRRSRAVQGRPRHAPSAAPAAPWSPAAAR